MKTLIPFVILLLALSGCVKPPEYPIVPAIEFVSVSSDYVYSGYTDTITISFTDGDGDIGTGGPGDDSCNICGLQTGDSTCLNLSSFNVYLIDHRDNCIATLASADVEPKGKFDALSGEIVIIATIDSKNCFPLVPGCKDTVVYSVVIKDKAGHRSNVVQTTPIVVDVE